MAGALGQWYVEIVAKGAPRVLAEADSIRKRLAVADRERDVQVTKEKRRLGVVEGAYARLGNVVRAQNIVMATAAFGFARAGLAGSTQAAALSVRLQQLSREVAALFLPAINASINALGQMVQWFRRLDGHGQDLAATIIGLGVAIKLAFSGHPILAAVAGMGALLASSREGRQLLSQLADVGKELVKIFGPLLSEALRGLKPILESLIPLAQQLADTLGRAVSGIQNIRERNTSQGSSTHLLNMAASGAQFVAPGIHNLLRPIVTGFEMQNRARGPRRPDGQRREVLPAGGSFEQFGETFRRVQSAVVREDIPSQQLREAQRTNELLNQAVLYLAGRGTIDTNDPRNRAIAENPLGAFFGAMGMRWLGP